MIYTGNFYLTIDQMRNNALQFYGYCNSRHPDWSTIAIAGMLGNMQAESTINPGIWQNLDEGNLELGYGLVQWTPAPKYLDWCTQNNYVPSAMLSAIKRLEFELDNGIQWYPTSYYNHSFGYFLTDSSITPYEAAMAFLRNYERPENLNQPNRGTQAEYWYTYITGHEPPTPGGDVYTGKPMPLYMMMLRRYF